MKIFKFNPESNLDFYDKTNFKNQLEIANFLDNFKNDQKFILHFYWKDLQSSFNEKHALAIKSAIITQDLNKCKIILWSDKDMSNNFYLKPLLNYIDHRIWDMENFLKKFNLKNIEKSLERDNGYVTSDIFRILCLGEYGGIYSDLDVIFLKDLSPLLDYEFTYLWPGINSQNNAIMRIDKQSDFFKTLIYTIKNLNEIRPAWFDLGQFLYKEVRQNFKNYSIFPTSWFDEDWDFVNFSENFKPNNNFIDRKGKFAWHWHNNWHSKVEKDSKFYLYDKKINEIFNAKFNLNKKHKFIYKDKNENLQISLIGSFNRWDENAHQLKYINGNWEIDVELPIGFHQYKFLINNNHSKKWELDNKNDKFISDGLGNINSLVHINDIKNEKQDKEKLKKIDRIIYCFWMNKSEMNEKRKANLKIISDISKTEVKLITLENLQDFILKDYPLHEGFKYLSAVHKSDYLRSYFMHFYGGGYCDIKKIYDDWDTYFDALDIYQDIYGVGYSPFIDCHGIQDANFKKFFAKNKEKIIGCSAFIFKKQTPITLDWYLSINSKMDAVFENLKKYPAQYNRDQAVPNGTLAIINELNEKYFRDDYFYPLLWEELHGNILYPLSFKYNKNILRIMRAPESGGNCLSYGCHLEKEF